MTFAPAVEIWRPLVERYAGDLPVDFLLKWIEVESGGNPCSYTSLRESGLFQLMWPDNLVQGGTSESALRAACSGSSQSLARTLAQAEAEEQVRSGVQYVNYVRSQARSKLSAAGVNWSESTPDFWSVVKLVHAYPGPIISWLTQATAVLGRPPANWAEFRPTVQGYESILSNAERVGAYGSGWQIPLAVAAVVAGGLLLYYFKRKRR